MTPAAPDAPAIAPDATSAPAAAESSPAKTTTTTPDAKFEVPKDPAAYKEWREKGTLPAAQSKPKKSEDSASSSSADGAEPEGQKDAPDSEPGDRKQESSSRTIRATAADRLNELLGDLKRAGLTPHELKTFKREVAKTDTQQAPAAKQDAAPETTAKPPAAAAEPQPPKLEDFKSWDEYRAAERKYNDDLVASRVQHELQQHLIKQQADQRMAEAKARYGDEAETYIRSTAAAVFNHADVPPVIKAVLNESPVLADVLYVMGTDSKQFDEFIELAKTNPGQALRKAILLEQLVQEELARGGKPAAAASDGTAPPPAEPERDESGKFVSSSKPPAQRKPAPPPASEVSGKASAPPDELASAIARNDFTAYRTIKNRQDLAARQGR